MFVPAVRVLFQRDAPPDSATYHAVLYLWNVETPEADDALRLAYDLGILRDEHRYQMRLCEALAARGDSRGLDDAFATLVDLKRPTGSPEDEESRRDRIAEREDRRSEAEDVFERASDAMLAKFLNGKATVDEIEPRRVVLRLLWRLPELPKPLDAAVLTWVDDPNPQVVNAAQQLLDRDGG